MRKKVLTLISASALLLSSLPNNTHSENTLNIKGLNSSINESAYSLPPFQNHFAIDSGESSPEVEQVASSSATAKSGSYKFKYNTNLRLNAGTKSKVLTVAKKGASATATHQKKVGSQVWYKVKVNGKHGWVLSTLLSPKTSTAKASTASKAATSVSSAYKVKYNSNVRANAGTNHKVVTLAKKGSTVKATSSKKVGSTTWFKITANGKIGWISGALLTKTTVAAKASVKSKAPVKASSKATAVSGSYKVNYNSNVRANAGTGYKIVTSAKKGSTVKATSSKKVGSTTWFKIKANGKTGWISGALLTKTTAAAKAPVKASSKVTAVSGSYKVNYNSNVRANAGTGYKIVTSAKKGSIVKATSSKKVGNLTWFKTTANGKTGWISGALLTKTTAAKAATVSKASFSVSPSAIISTALSLKGIPYRFGGTTTAGFDCSGFIQYVYKQHGISVSRTTLTQFAETTKVSSPKPGDLVFFANTYRAGISHVGIYIGNNQFVHSGGSKAEVKSLNDVYWGPKFYSFKRF
ncbi:SH3 domain-containing protein [Planococcus shenhongbingii]|uniref:C40 family peptidase n=1 Tax=Planococcus shenhongbingii TaxID=3058398 RepID=UPI002634811F|nr:SH3 domain-containing protein [Planococcus sp. N016]WKA57738.1 SH3 domain-containing protein [Planococcus sp. N016]